MSVRLPEVEAFHEPDPKSGNKLHALQTRPRRFNVSETREAFEVRPACRRFRFLVSMRGCKTVTDFHEERNSTQGFKATKDCLPFIHERFESMEFTGRFMVPMRVQLLVVGASHKPRSRRMEALASVTAIRMGLFPTNLEVGRVTPCAPPPQSPKPGAHGVTRPTTQGGIRGSKREIWFGQFLPRLTRYGQEAKLMRQSIAGNARPFIIAVQRGMSRNGSGARPSSGAAM